MANEALKQSIAQVRTLMQAALDSKERDLLSDLMTKIGEDHHDAVDDDLKDELDRKAVDFEAEHPKLAGAVREVMDALNKLGL